MLWRWRPTMRSHVNNQEKINIFFVFLALPVFSSEAEKHKVNAATNDEYPDVFLFFSKFFLIKFI